MNALARNKARARAARMAEARVTAHKVRVQEMYNGVRDRSVFAVQRFDENASNVTRRMLDDYRSMSRHEFHDTYTARPHDPIPGEAA